MKDNVPFTVSHERIYTHINQDKDKDKGGDLYTHLRGRKKYRKRNGLKMLVRLSNFRKGNHNLEPH
jgi:IS30 family transposase